MSKYKKPKHETEWTTAATAITCKRGNSVEI